MRLRWTPEAASNLEEIYLYLVVEQPSQATSTIRAINETVRSLSQMSHRGRIGRIPDTRELLVSALPFIVVYRIQHDAVHVLSIRHTARQPLHEG